MAENGILDYQGMNQAIYRGATSNIIVDTQSMSIEIGAGNSSHTSNLHIECDHDANVASIQLNSNVVTEFSRSKKLIKYPRVALTQNDESGTSGYVADASTRQNTDRQAWKVFNNLIGYSQTTETGPASYPGSNGWRSVPGYTTNGVYNKSPPANLGTDSGGTAFTSSDEGEWIQIKLPNKIYLKRFSLQPRYSIGFGIPEFVKNGNVWGSNDGSSWYRVYTFTNITPTDETTFITFDDVNSLVAYNYFALVVNETNRGSTDKDTTSLNEWELFGIPEYDPEAHGTDVTVKSYPNVPNTDWLEVYYDAKGLNAGAATTVTALGGTAISATTLGDPQVSDEAFVFDGSGDAIVSGATSLSGNPPLSYSVWFKTNSIISGSNSIVAIGYAASYKSIGFRIQNTTGKYRFYVFTGATGESVDTDIKAELGKWTHATIVYDGLNSKLYIDGQFAVENTNTTSDLDLDSGAKVALGNYIDVNGNLYNATASYNGSIANFRLFNRALTTDEIYQLYAYQKEYFGLGDLSMTLKAGRLGIGTSEPRGALDVRGVINATRFNTLVAERAVGGSTVDSIEFSNLNLIGDGGTYKIIFKARNTSATNPQYYMTVNGDTTEGNYFYGGVQFTTVLTPHQGNYPTIFRAGQDSNHTLEITMTRSCDGYIVAHGQGNFHTGNNLNAGASQGWELNRWFYKNPGNVTSILFSSANPNTGRYGPGSSISIHRYM